MNDNFMYNLRAAVDRLVPSYTVAHNARGNELVDSGDYDTAIAEFDEAIRLTPFVAEIYSDHGRAHAVKGDVGLALADYDEAIRLDPYSAPAHFNRANLLRPPPSRCRRRWRSGWTKQFSSKSAPGVNFCGKRCCWYIEECEWRQLLRYGEETARERGIGPEDVADLAEEYRAR